MRPFVAQGDNKTTEWNMSWILKVWKGDIKAVY